MAELPALTAKGGYESVGSLGRNSSGVGCVVQVNQFFQGRGSLLANQDRFPCVIQSPCSERHFPRAHFCGFCSKVLGIDFAEEWERPRPAEGRNERTFDQKLEMFSGPTEA